MILQSTNSDPTPALQHTRGTLNRSSYIDITRTTSPVVHQAHLSLHYFYLQLSTMSRKQLATRAIQALARQMEVCPAGSGMMHSAQGLLLSQASRQVRAGT